MNEDKLREIIRKNIELVKEEITNEANKTKEPVILTEEEINERIEFLNINEGQFSWMTMDTDRQIGSEKENTITVYMHDNEGNTWKEKNYEGYGVFGGMDYYELVATMNGYTQEDAKKKDGLRDIGIDVAFGKKKSKTSKKPLFPALTERPKIGSWHNFTEEPESDPNQSWYVEPEYDDEDYDEDDY